MWVKESNVQTENVIANQENAVQATPEMLTETNSLNPKGHTKKVTHEYSY